MASTSLDIKLRYASEGAQATMDQMRQVANSAKDIGKTDLGEFGTEGHFFGKLAGGSREGVIALRALEEAFNNANGSMVKLATGFATGLGVGAAIYGFTTLIEKTKELNDGINKNWESMGNAPHNIFGNIAIGLGLSNVYQPEKSIAYEDSSEAIRKRTTSFIESMAGKESNLPKDVAFQLVWSRLHGGDSDSDMKKVSSGESLILPKELNTARMSSDVNRRLEAASRQLFELKQDNPGNRGDQPKTKAAYDALVSALTLEEEYLRGQLEYLNSITKNRLKYENFLNKNKINIGNYVSLLDTKLKSDKAMQDTNSSEFDKIYNEKLYKITDELLNRANVKISTIGKYVGDTTMERNLFPGGSGKYNLFGANAINVPEAPPAVRQSFQPNKPFNLLSYFEEAGNPDNGTFQTQLRILRAGQKKAMLSPIIEFESTMTQNADISLDIQTQNKSRAKREATLELFQKHYEQKLTDEEAFIKENHLENNRDTSQYINKILLSRLSNKSSVDKISKFTKLEEMEDFYSNTKRNSEIDFHRMELSAKIYQSQYEKAQSEIRNPDNYGRHTGAIMAGTVEAYHQQLEIARDQANVGKDKTEELVDEMKEANQHWMELLNRGAQTIIVQPMN